MFVFHNTHKSVCFKDVLECVLASYWLAQYTDADLVYIQENNAISGEPA